MTIVLTGAAGMIGAEILERLRQADCSVRVLSHGPADRFGGVDVLPLPRPDADETAFDRALHGADHIVHCAAINGGDKTVTGRQLLEANAVLTGRLAKAAARQASGRFVYLSSIRAVAGAEWSGVISEATDPMPSCPYGCSKLAGEQAVREAFGNDAARMTILRLAPVYGPAMRGALSILLRVADTPWPLPFGSLKSPKAVLSLRAAADAVIVVLGDREAPRTDYIISDAAPLSIAEIVAAYRNGLARPRRIYPLPSPVFRAAASLLGRRDAWGRLHASQTCDPTAFAARGWRPEIDSAKCLAALAREITAGRNA